MKIKYYHSHYHADNNRIFESCGFAVCSTGSSQLYRRRKALLKINGATNTGRI